MDTEIVVKAALVATSWLALYWIFVGIRSGLLMLARSLVVRGDSLAKVATRVSASWKSLRSLNRLETAGLAEARVLLSKAMAELDGKAAAQNPTGSPPVSQAPSERVGGGLNEWLRRLVRRELERDRVVMDVVAGEAHQVGKAALTMAGMPGFDTRDVASGLLLGLRDGDDRTARDAAFHLGEYIDDPRGLETLKKVAIALPRERKESVARELASVEKAIKD